MAGNKGKVSRFDIQGFRNNHPKITLIAASKTRDESEISTIFKQGIQDFGENYIQEAASKTNKEGYTRHFIGHLQSNKAEVAVQLFHVIHTVDSIKLANALQKACTKHSKAIEAFIQINMGKEEQKGGVLPEKAPELVSHIKNNCPNLTLLGFMCIPPHTENPRSYFRSLKNMAKKQGLKALSMGMSKDWGIAIEEGATHIRIGEAIFGKRPPKTAK